MTPRKRVAVRQSLWALSYAVSSMEGARFNPWHVWLGPAGFVLALAFSTVAAGAIGAVASPADGPGVTAVATVAQNTIFILTAFALARLAGGGAPRRLGLRRAGLRSSLRWLAQIGVLFYAFLMLYGALVQPGTPQTILEDLGARETTLLLVTTAVLVVAVAPFTEEILFRGLFYGALRSRLRPLPAALIVSGVFSLLHVSNADTWLLVPPLIVLGIAFCQLYERTGSLYPAIALHVINNAVAFTGTIDDDAGVVVGAVCGVVALAACLVLPRLQMAATVGAQPLHGAQNRS